MSDLALRTVNLSKRYQIGVLDPYQRIRQSVKYALRQGKRAVLHRPPLPPRAAETDFLWALEDICFEVRHGEAVGIIGRNGAGKTTLLKILAHITRPTRGYADVYGRLGALLEVGTGFHPELTGRENIYLNATILGLKRHEIARRFDEIVAFAEVEKFIDTPVKHYSSGMFARLAFSVAAHLDPDILVVDEVLSVGDTAFQKKSMGKMGAVMGEGRTVLFVSHSIPSIVSFCNRCLWLEDGKLIMDGPAVEVTQKYLDKSTLVPNEAAVQNNLSQVTSLLPEENVLPAPDGTGESTGKAPVIKYQSGAEREQTSENTREAMNRGERYGSGKARFKSIQLTALTSDGRPSPAFFMGYDLKVDLKILAYEKIMDANVAAIIFDLTGTRIIDVSTAIKDEFLTMEPGQEAHVRFVLHNVLLKPDTYRLHLWIGRRNIEDIDGIPFAKAITVEVNPARLRHFQIFPGVYQCDFSHDLLMENTPENK